MDISNTLDDTVGALDGKQAVQRLFSLRAKGILAVEDIKRDDNADQQVEQDGNRRYNAGHQRDQLRQRAVLHPVDDLCGELLIQL